MIPKYSLLVQVKTQLAEKALQAAKAAEAALSGKQAVVEQLQQQVKEAEGVVAENTAAVHQQQSTVNAAVQAAQQASAEVRRQLDTTDTIVALQITTVLIISTGITVVRCFANSCKKEKTVSATVFQI